MTLAVNSVLRYDAADAAQRQRIVVLYVSPDGSSGWSLDLDDPKALPVPFLRDDLERHLDDGWCTIDSPNHCRHQGVLSTSASAVQDARWDAIRAQVKDEPKVYDPAERSAMYRQAAERGGLTLNTARSLFQIYWRGGKTPSALAPSFGLRGGPGSVREPGAAKLGRPRSPGQFETGLNLSRDQKRAVASIARAEFRRNKRHRLVTCYKAWLNRLFYCDGLDAQGRPARVPKPEYEKTGVPTLQQFKRIYYSLTDVIETHRIRNPRDFTLNSRPLTGSATAETWGPGSRFLIDATMADIYLVSRDNPNRIVGRPVIYVVIDVWSRLIVGLYVAIEDASWTSAMMALSNAACSKVAFCAEHGIEISEDDWPAGNIAARLLSDKGEVDGKSVENLVTHFNRTIEATAAYRGDLKGLVETQFNTLQVQFGEFVPGYVAKDFGVRGVRDYRLDAVLNINEFTATMIDLVLERNSKTITRYDRDQGMPAEMVQLTPIELWHWGIQHRSGRYQAWPEEYVRFRLMPTKRVSVDRNGISFQGRSYVCDGVLRMMTLARQGKGGKVWISFDPRVTDTVYLHSAADSRGFQVAALHQNSRAFAGRTCVEADQDQQMTGEARRGAQTVEVTKSINVGQRLEKRVLLAKSRKDPADDRPKSHRTKNIRQHRAEEKAETKLRDGEAYRPAVVEPRPSAAVIKFPSPTPADFAERGLADFMED